MIVTGYGVGVLGFGVGVCILDKRHSLHVHFNTYYTHEYSVLNSI